MCSRCYVTESQDVIEIFCLVGLGVYEVPCV